jgi:hypothetical protein
MSIVNVEDTFNQGRVAYHDDDYSRTAELLVNGHRAAQHLEMTVTSDEWDGIRELCLPLLVGLNVVFLFWLFDVLVGPTAEEKYKLSILFGAFAMFGVESLCWPPPSIRHWPSAKRAKRRLRIVILTAPFLALAIACAVLPNIVKHKF